MLWIECAFLLIQLHVWLNAMLSPCRFQVVGGYGKLEHPLHLHISTCNIFTRCGFYGNPLQLTSSCSKLYISPFSDDCSKPRPTSWKQKGGEGAGCIAIVLTSTLDMKLCGCYNRNIIRKTNIMLECLDLLFWQTRQSFSWAFQTIDPFPIHINRNFPSHQ